MMDQTYISHQEFLELEKSKKKKRKKKEAVIQVNKEAYNWFFLVK
jgi:hypothetical protein